MTEVNIEFPPKLIPVFEGAARYRGAYGGRGSGKSFSFAKMAAIRGYQEPMTILCCREIQNSIKDSVHAELSRAIESEPFLDAFYEIGESFIRGKNGTHFIFKGLYRNLATVKSMAGIKLCWVEEAETVSEKSWQTLIPTIREQGSEIWLTWNRESVDSATNQRFIVSPPESSKIVELNWKDNPWFPDELEAERQADLKRDPDLYSHIWEGDYITRTEAQIFKDRWRVDEFEPSADWTVLHGMDFGFANDPTCLVRCWIHGETLFIEYDDGAVGLELDDTAKFFTDRIPNCDQYKIRADNARPESISYLKRTGLPLIEPCVKGKGSVQDGIEFIKSFADIVIHPRCVEMQKEARLYSYKVDRLSGDVLPVIVDANNHRWDAVRYALEPVMKNALIDYGEIL